jgi:alcohol dehydrogenase class IV
MNLAAAVKVDWYFPFHVRFGPGRVAEVPQICRAHGIARPLVVTDRGLADHAMVRQLLDRCRRGQLAASLFGHVHSNPTDGDVEEGIEAYRAGKHDAVVAIGGGSGLDAGKAVAMLAGNACTLHDLEWSRVQENEPELTPDRLAPVICIPTTAGTGAEMDPGAVITDRADGRKYVIYHSRLPMPASICDPVLTLSLPPELTAWTGLDAFSHALEAFLVPAYHPICDGIALEAMRLIAAWLPVAVARSRDLEARANMLAAAALAAMGFQKGLGAVHAISHAVGAVCDTHHGLTNAVVLPHVLRFNQPACDAKLGRAAGCLGLKQATADAFIEWVVAFLRRFGVPERLQQIGAAPSRIRELAAKAMLDPCHATNPIVPSFDDMRELVRQAVCGGHRR